MVKKQHQKLLLGQTVPQGVREEVEGWGGWWREGGEMDGGGVGNEKSKKTRRQTFRFPLGNSETLNT